MPSTGSVDMTPEFHECQPTEAPLLLQGISIEELSAVQFRAVPSPHTPLSQVMYCAAVVQGISVEELSVEQFRRKCVEPMGEESDEVHIVALTDVLQVGL